MSDWGAIYVTQKGKQARTNTGENLQKFQLISFRRI